MKRRRTIALSILFLLLAGGGYALFAWWSSNLLRYAWRAPSVPAIGPEGLEWRHVAWASDHTILIARGTSLAEYDTQTGKGTTVELKPPGEPMGTINDNGVPIDSQSIAGMSPDGRWLEWLLELPESRSFVPILVERTGPKKMKLPVGSSYRLVWTPDARSCYGELYSPNNPISLTEIYPDTNVTKINKTIHGAGTWIDLNGTIVSMAKGRTGRTFNYTFYRVRTKDNQPLDPLPVELPEGSYVEAVSMSPRGDRLMWYLGIMKQPPNFLDRLLGLLGRRDVDPRQPYQAEGIWISANDGSNMHCLGTVRGEFAPKGMYMPAWLPDGKRVSFFYDGGLYIIPAS